MERGQQLSLHLWQFDAGAVASLESRFVHAHLLSFETGRDTANEYHGLCLTNLRQQFGSGGIDFLLDVEIQGTVASFLYIVDLYAVVMPRFDI